MPDTTWPVRYAGRVPGVGGAITSHPVASDRWSTRAEFRGPAPDTAGAVWFTAVSFDVDVTPGTIGEVRFKSTVDSTGITWVSDPVQITGPTIGGVTKWLKVRESGGAVEEHQQEVQLRRVSGTGSVHLLDARAGWVSTPPAADQQPSNQAAVAGQADSDGGGVQTVTNPAQGTGNTMIAVAVVPGPLFDQPSPAGWTNPTVNGVEVQPIADYETSQPTDPGFGFTHRVRVWQFEDDGTADFTFGYETGNGDSQTAYILALDRPTPEVRVTGPVADSSPNTPYPAGFAGVDYLGITLATVQNSDEVTAGPPGWAQQFNNTTVSPTNRRRLAVHSSTIGAGPLVPGNSTYATDPSAHVHFTIAVPPGAGTAPVSAFARVPSADLSYEMAPGEPATYDTGLTTEQFQRIAGGGNRLNNGSGADEIGPSLAPADQGGYNLTFDASSELHGFAMDGTTRTSRLATETRGGVLGLKASVCYVEDGSYSSANNNGNGTNLVMNRPPSDPRYFDGIRSQVRLGNDPADYMSADGTTRVLAGLAFEVEAWMLTNTWTTGPFELHAPDAASGRSSPLQFNIVNGTTLEMLTRSKTTGVLTAGETTPAPVQQFTHSLGAPGERIAFVVDAILDPLGANSRLDLYFGINNAPMPQVVSLAGPWGYQVEASQSPNLYYVQTEQMYSFGSFSPGPLNNWDGTSADGNIRDLWVARSTVDLEDRTTPAALISDLRHFLSGGS